MSEPWFTAQSSAHDDFLYCSLGTAIEKQNLPLEGLGDGSVVQVPRETMGGEHSEARQVDDVEKKKDGSIG